MRLLELPTLSSHIIELLKQEYEQEKPIPHLTELVYCLTKSYYDREKPVEPTEREILLFCLGIGLEKHLLVAQRKQVSGCHEGIFYSPDFINLTGFPGELKTTRSSSSKFGEGFFPITWERQILGYMKCFSVTSYNLTVLFLMGNWKPPFPELRSYRVEASIDEINENWNWIQARKIILDECRKNKVVPTPQRFCEAWECKECRYWIRCEEQLIIKQED